MDSAPRATNNGWTGGQYSLYRVAFGVLLFVAFAQGFESGNPLWILGEIFVIPLILGFRERFLSVVPICYVFVAGILFDFVFGYGLFVLPLALSVFLPKQPPYGSLDAVGRPDPGGGWSMPNALFETVWGVLCVAYAADALVTLVYVVANLDSVLTPGASLAARLLGAYIEGVGTTAMVVVSVVVGFQLAFALLALSRRSRRWLWTAMLVVQTTIFVFFGRSAFDAGFLALHLLAFDPAWIAPKIAGTADLVFYDGSCGLCHRAVRFILAEDRSETAFRFAPLGGEAFLASIPESQRAGLPDSVAIVTPEGVLLTRSAAVIRILHRLGGFWRVIGAGGDLVPASVLDFAYDGVARIRHRLFARPKDACPIIPKHLRARFDG
jgi:predicted DCC family thiol-disulfide oxidoreductase YuxK